MSDLDPRNWTPQPAARVTCAAPRISTLSPSLSDSRCPWFQHCLHRILNWGGKQQAAALWQSMFSSPWETRQNFSIRMIVQIYIKITLPLEILEAIAKQVVDFECEITYKHIKSKHPYTRQSIKHIHQWIRQIGNVSTFYWLDSSWKCKPSRTKVSRFDVISHPTREHNDHDDS